MKFKYKIKGLGVIEEAEIEIAPFTLIAGKNNSGKSFITKSLYCILDALNDDYIASFLYKQYREIKENFLIFYDDVKNPAQIDRDFFNLSQKFLTSIDYQIFQEDKFLIIDELKNFLNEIDKYIEKRKNVKKFKSILAPILENKMLVEKMIEILNHSTPYIVEKIDENLNINFKKNFVIKDIRDIVNINKQKFQLEIENIGKISLDKEKEELYFSLSKGGINQIQRLSNIIYIDSPVYTKLMKALKNNFLDIFNGFLGDYPLYIDKFYKFLEKQYIKEPDFLYLSDKIQNLIKGKFEIDIKGNINYIFANKKIPLSLTAMGVTNIGIVDMLIRNNAINRGSFLIIDEPEVHLHPEWQVEFIKILYEISKAGANVIITSHSIDVVKAIELLIKKDNKNIAINKMPFSKEFDNKTIEEKVEKILDDLGSPFYEMYMQGL